MIHTAELTVFPTKALRLEYMQLEDTKLSQEGEYYNAIFKDYGLEFTLKVLKKDNYTTFRLVCRLNLCKLVHPSDSITLIESWEVPGVEQRFNDLVLALCPQMPTLSEWYATRIDFSVNIHTPYVTTYLKLLKKGNRTSHMQDWLDSDRNRSQKEGSLYLVGKAKHFKNRSVTVNTYDKLKQILDTKGMEADVELQELAKDILRFEIQCHAVKTDNLKKKHGMESKSLMEYLKPEIAYGVLDSYLRILAGSADYRRKSVAIQMIQESKYRKKTKERLVWIIEQVGIQHNAVYKVRDSYITDREAEGLTKKQAREEFNSLIRRLNELNVNPVAISDNERIDGLKRKDGLTSIYTLFLDTISEDVKEQLKLCNASFNVTKLEADSTKTLYNFLKQILLTFEVKLCKIQHVDSINPCFIVKRRLYESF